MKSGVKMKRSRLAAILPTHTEFALATVDLIQRFAVFIAVAVFLFSESKSYSQAVPPIERLRVRTLEVNGTAFSPVGEVHLTLAAADVAQIKAARIQARVFRGRLDSLQGKGVAFDPDGCNRFVSFVVPVDEIGSQLTLRLGLSNLSVSTRSDFYQSERFVIVWERVPTGAGSNSQENEVMRIHKSALSEYFIDATEIMILAPNRSNDTVAGYKANLEAARVGVATTIGDGTGVMKQIPCHKAVKDQKDETTVTTFVACTVSP